MLQALMLLHPYMYDVHVQHASAAADSTTTNTTWAGIRYKI